MSASETQAIHEKLDKVLSQVSEFGESLAVTGERCATHRERTDGHKRTLYGLSENGEKPGLVGRVDRVEQTVGRYQAYVWAVGVAIVGVIVFGISTWIGGE